MNKLRYIFIVGLLLLGLGAAGQTQRYAPRYERVYKNNFWNTSSNVTGVRQDSVSRSFAEVYGKYQGGGFHDTWQASKGWSAGARTASIRHMEKISYTGSFAFDQTEGYDMCGSMFIKPGYYPVDILEFTPGRKVLQTYSFDGGLSYDIADSWRLGAKVDFESANIAKRKDLRHSNFRLDFSAKPGIMYHQGTWAIGANYIFRKTSELIEASQIGISDASYYAFLDKGLMYGVYSVWDGSGTHLKESGMKYFPAKEFSNGAAIQLQADDFFAEAKYINTNGSIGEKEYIWFRFPGNEVALTGAWTDEGHSVRVDASWKRQDLDESILEKVKENGVDVIYNHGSNRILSKETMALSAEYEYITEVLELTVGADIQQRKTLSSQMYPYIYTQALVTWKSWAEALVQIGRVDLKGRFAFGGGECTDNGHMADENSGVTSTPYRLQQWYDRQLEYTTAKRLDAGLGVRYNFKTGLYLEAAGELLHGLKLQYLTGPNRFTAALRLGYNF